MFTSPGYNGTIHELQTADGIAVSLPYTTPDGTIITSAIAPHKPSSTGRVCTQEPGANGSSEFYPSVFGLKWVLKWVQS